MAQLIPQHKWRAKEVVLKSGNDGVFMRVQSRMDELKKSFLDFDYNNISDEAKAEVDSVLRQAFVAAVKKIAPLDEPTFKKFGIVNRIKSKAKASWMVGYSTGESLKELQKIKPTIKAAKQGNITLYYDIPSKVLNKFAPMSQKDWRFKSMNYRAEVIHDLILWISKKGVRSNKGYSTKEFAWAIANAWANNYPDKIHKTDRTRVVGLGGKPDISTERALRITLNESAREAFVGVLREKMPQLSSSITKSIIDKTLKK